MKVTVFKYHGVHGDGLVFIDNEHTEFLKIKEKYDADGRFFCLGDHDLPNSFIAALGGFDNGVVGKEYSGH